MSDTASAAAKPVIAKTSIEQAILAGPILPTILRLAAPNVFTVSVQTAVAIVETWYVGQTGIVSLAERQEIADCVSTARTRARHAAVEVIARRTGDTRLAGVDTAGLAGR